jgi:hypothetical protein
VAAAKTRKTTAKKSTAKNTTAKNTTAKNTTAKNTTAKNATAKNASDTFAEAFAGLERILLRHVRPPLAAARREGEVLVKGPVVPKWKKELWFGQVRRGRAYVSYHLMTVYAFPELLRGMSPGLRARMQGKTCFNFRRAEPDLFAELDDLTGRCVERLRVEGALPHR